MFRLALEQAGVQTVLRALPDFQQRGGLGEIIETAMAKNRDERYASMADMLDDLHAVGRNEPPIHAHRPVDIGKLEEVEVGANTGTIDIPPEEVVPKKSVWTHPAFIALLAWAACSVVVIGIPRSLP